MCKSILSLIVLSLLAAAPAAAISPGIAVPKAAANTGTPDSTQVPTNLEEGHAPDAFAADDCRAQHRSFISRNTVQPSVRRAAIAACDAAVASAQAN